MPIRLKPSALLAPSDDGYLVYDVQAARLHHLNPIASLLVELCDGSHDVEAIRTAVLPLVGEVGWDASRDWIDGALRDGWLTTAAEAPGEAMSSGELSALATRLWDDDAVLEAFICQQRAAELAPDDPAIWYTLGELAQILERRDDARLAYERYLNKRPDDAEIAHLLISLRGEPAPNRASDDCIEQLYTRFASFYDETMTGDLEYRAPALLRDAVAVALGERRQVEVLDLGCGTGLAGAELRPFARRLVGVDLSAAMIEHARARAVYDALHVGEITSALGDANGRFDVIIACDTLIYFGDLGQVVAPAAGRLTPGGLIAFTLERGDVHPFALTDSGRFAHHEDHVRAVAGGAGLIVSSLEQGVLRYEYGHPVHGLVIVLKSASG